jgi:hypothetical protein
MPSDPIAEPLLCPKCRKILVPVAGGGVATWNCEDCGSVAVTVAVLRQFVPKARMNALWARVRGDAPQGKAPCPSCARPMRHVEQTMGTAKVPIDACGVCQMVSFSAEAIVAFAPKRLEPRPNAGLSAESRRALAEAIVASQPIRGAQQEEQDTEAGLLAHVLLRILVGIGRIS